MTPLISAALYLATSVGFTQSCTPAQGRLLSVLAGGVGAGGVIGETGTGCGVGLAWLLAGASPGARLVSVERDADRFGLASSLFADEPAVRLLHGDWRSLQPFGPFDLLVLDGGGQGKKDEPPLDPAEWLKIGGLVVMDDFTPFTSWPPMYEGRIDEARLYWMDHPLLRITEIRVAPDQASLVGTRWT